MCPQGSPAGWDVLISCQTSPPPSPALLPVFCKITFQICHLCLDPCLEACFWGTQDHWCLYSFLPDLILFPVFFLTKPLMTSVLCKGKCHPCPCTLTLYAMCIQRSSPPLYSTKWGS